MLSLFDTLSLNGFSIKILTFDNGGYLGPFIIINWVGDSLAHWLEQVIQRKDKVGLATIGLYGKYHSMLVKHQKLRVHTLISMYNTTNIEFIFLGDMHCRVSQTQSIFLKRQVVFIFIRKRNHLRLTGFTSKDSTSRLNGEKKWLFLYQIGCDWPSNGIVSQDQCRKGWGLGWFRYCRNDQVVVPKNWAKGGNGPLIRSCAAWHFLS